MARPCCKRRVDLALCSAYFAPRGVPVCSLEVLVLALDEVEALRLADYEGKYHEEAARQMGVSRATFGRIVESARHKAADALVHGKALRLEGGNVELAARRVAPAGVADGAEGRGGSVLPCGLAFDGAETSDTGDLAGLPACCPLRTGAGASPAPGLCPKARPGKGRRKPQEPPCP